MRSYSPYPRSPITGVIPWAGQSISGAQNLSGVPLFNPGHWALGVQKFQSVRFQFCACLFRTNAPILFSAVGAGALTRPPRNGLICP